MSVSVSGECVCVKKHTTGVFLVGKRGFGVGVGVWFGVVSCLLIWFWF